MSTPHDASQPSETPPEFVAQDQVHSFVRKLSFGTLLFRGIFALIIGVLMLLAPAILAPALGTLAAVFIGVGLVVYSVAEFVDAHRERKADEPGWGWIVATGIISLLLGLLFIVFPLISGSVLLLVASWIIVAAVLLRGIFVIASRYTGGWSTLLGVLVLIAGLVLGVLLLVQPGTTIISLVWVLGLFAIVSGIISLVLAFRVRKILKDAGVK
ncbi:HdeD family acid-resistance protein [Auritidibacter ignavus]|uniref:HdeD family acid-resistance protein n=1 Tax=Auritidibacter ignavus TaxID=678932 RepID=UPI00109CE4D4|nr:DUF308 domain-containing protein [Auritidibacter ignavus]